MITERAAQQIAQMIVAGLSDRRGFRQAWDEMDPGLRAELLAAWAKIVQAGSAGSHDESA